MLEQRQPLPKEVSRRSSWFACDTPALAAKYLEGEFAIGRRQLAEGQPRLYAIRMNTCLKQPMRLAEAASRALLDDKIDLAQKLADAYWTPPDLKLQFWEYFSPEIEVLAEETWPDLIARTIALETYSADGKILKPFVAELENSVSASQTKSSE